MKRIILSVAALLAGTVAIAQTPQTIVSPAQQTVPTAAATVGGNYSNVDQKGIGSDALVSQQGTANGSYISQTGTNATNRNTATVLQWGNVQPSISGHLNYSDIAQSGEGNAYTVTQQGDLNENYGVQVGLDNTALVQQGANTPQQAESNLALVDQDGKDNYAEVQQRWDNNEASILQRNDQAAGVGNRSFQSQGANPNQSAGHVAIGEQYGDNNELIQIQDGGTSGLGLGNYAESDQGDAAVQATDAFTQQVQEGDLNEAYSSQRLVGDSAFQEQVGTGNLAVNKQNLIGLASGGNNSLEQYQAGNNNEARSTQAGNDNQAFQEQYQDDNYSSIFQANGQVAGNIATSIQNGFDNSSVINQRANGNMAVVDQTGNGQVSVVNQNNPLSGSPAATSGSNSAVVIQRNANVALTAQMKRAAATAAHSF